MSKWRCLVLVSVLGALAPTGSADWICEVNIRKEGTNIVTSYGVDHGTNVASRAWYGAVAPTATNAALNVTLTLGDMTFLDAVGAIEDVVRPWPGPVYLNITTLRADATSVTLTTLVRTGKDITVRRSPSPPVARRER